MSMKTNVSRAAGAFVCSLVLAALAPFSARSADKFTNYAFKAYITFSGYAGATTLTNFPALVRIADGVGGFDYDDCTLANGQDVRFTLGDGGELPSECVTWNAAGTSEFWVRIPELTAATRIMMFWGNPSAPERDRTTRVWDDTYHAVLSHEDVGCSLLDSSTYGNHGATSCDTATNGIVGGARYYNGSQSGWFGCLDDPALKVKATFTYDFWVKSDSTPDGNYLLVTRGGAGFNRDAYIVRYRTDNKFAMTLNNSETIVGTAVPPGEWHHVMFSCTPADDHRLVIDGKFTASRTRDDGSGNYAESIPLIGGTTITGYNMGAKPKLHFDEMRYSSVIRSDDYARAVYLNAASNALFQTIAATPGNVVNLAVDSVPRTEVGENVRYISTGADELYADGVKVASVPEGAKQVVTVHPVRREYKVSVGKEGDEAAVVSVSPAGDNGWYAEGAEITLSATPSAATNAFYAWGGNCPTTQIFTAATTIRVSEPLSLAARFGTAYYVAPEAGGASDANNGLSPSTPKATIEATVEAINAITNHPAVVFVADGTYTMTNTTSKTWGINLAKPIAVKALNVGRAVINIGGVETRGAINISSRAAYVEGLCISNYNGTGTGGDNFYGHAINSSGHFAKCLFRKSRTCGRQRSVIQLSGGWMRDCDARDLTWVFSGSGDGSGLCHEIRAYGGALIENCIITNCYGRNGGGLRNAGSCRVRNTLFGDCRTNSGNGGGVYAGADGLILENVTVADCYASSSGGGIYASSPCVVLNSVVSGNTVPTITDGYNFKGMAGFVSTLCPDAPVGNGNILATASFADAAWHPEATSLSRDAGRYAPWQEWPWVRDLDGTNRLYGSSVDMGAYEFIPKGKEALAVQPLSDVVTGTDALTVSFCAFLVGDTDGLAYYWDFGDGTKSSAATPQHTYTAPGYYTVTISVTNALNEGATFTSGQMIKVYATTCYMSNNGSNTEPYGSPATASPSMAEILKCSPQRILVAPGEYETTQEINAGAIEVVGESPETTFLSLNNGYNGKIILSGTMFSGITVRNYDNRHSPASGGVSVGGTTVISNCVFTGFRHDWGLSMLTVSAGTAKLIDTVFRNANSAAISYTGGNASFERCVISNQTSSAANCGVNTTLFRNCLIAGNTGSGITASGTLIVENTTIVSNANGIVMSGSGLAMTNAIIAANMTADVTVGEGFTASIANSCFAEADSIPSGAVTVSKSLAADPMFNFGAKKKLPYYGILGASPCKNTGVNAAWMDEATDLAGNRRRVGMVDMGCYEHPTAIFVITVR